MRALNSSPVDSIEEAVIFPFDRRSMPFSRDLNLTLQAGRTNPAEMDHGLSVDIDDRHPEHPVLTYGPPGSLDSTEIICPHVFHIDGEYRMWYVGADDNHQRRGGLYATSKDGFNWERPKLRLSEENGNKDNNRVAGPCGNVFYDPSDLDPQRRFKSIFSTPGPLRKSASFSADGLHWTRATDSDDIFGTGMEGGNIQKWGGCYYVNGQGGPSSMNRPIPHPIKQASKRLVVSFASYDFVSWTHAAAMGIAPRSATSACPGNLRRSFRGTDPRGGSHLEPRESAPRSLRAVPQRYQRPPRRGAGSRIRSQPRCAAFHRARTRLQDGSFLRNTGSATTPDGLRRAASAAAQRLG